MAERKKKIKKTLSKAAKAEMKMFIPPALIDLLAGKPKKAAKAALGMQGTGNRKGPLEYSTRGAFEAYENTGYLLPK